MPRAALVFRRGAIMLNCRQATLLISQSQDRELTRKEKIALKIHLILCSACRKFNKQISSLKGLSQMYVDEKAPISKKNKK